MNFWGEYEKLCKCYNNVYIKLCNVSQISSYYDAFPCSWSCYCILPFWHLECLMWKQYKVILCYWGRILQQGISIVAVDVFVLISGWFSIKPKTKSICSFLFQIAFLQILSYAVFVSAGFVEFSKESFKDLMMLKPFQGWFIKAYLLLYIISPVLNTFVENASKRILRKKRYEKYFL